MIKRKSVLILIWVMLLGPLSNESTAQEGASRFRASSVKIDITPEEPKLLRGYGPRMSEGVHDRIHHRIVAMDDGSTQFFLISTDFVYVSPSFYKRVSEELEEEIGISGEQVWWTVTHTHSAPAIGPPGLPAIMLPERYNGQEDPNPAYSEWAKEVLIDGIKKAQSKLEPARLGVTTGRSLANINRRAKGVDGSISLGMNPGGPVDRQIGLIRLERPDGSPIALIANYAMHGTVLGGENLQISGDAPGIVAKYVEEKLGAPMLYINGAAGDIAPIYSTYPDFRSGHITQFKVLLGDKILAANQKIHDTTSKVSLWTGEKVIETPRKEEFGWVKELSEYSRVTSTGATKVRLPISFLGINEDIVIWSAPVELFSEIATYIRRQSPYPYTFYFGYSNGWLGYLPTKQAFSEGGYEANRVTPFTKQVEADLTEGVLNYLQSRSRQQ